MATSALIAIPATARADLVTVQGTATASADNDFVGSSLLATIGFDVVDGGSFEFSFSYDGFKTWSGSPGFFQVKSRDGSGVEIDSLDLPAPIIVVVRDDEPIGDGTIRDQFAAYAVSEFNGTPFAAVMSLEDINHTAMPSGPGTYLNALSSWGHAKLAIAVGEPGDGSLGVTAAVASITSLGATVLPSPPQITIDATALTTPAFLIPGKTGILDGRQPQTVGLAPGAYNFQVASGYLADFTFSVTTEGRVDYDSAFDGFLGGRGTDTLLVRGYRVHLDATRLSTTGLMLVAAHNAMVLDSRVVQELTLAPASYYSLQPGSGVLLDLAFGVGIDGNVTYSHEFDAYVSGRGTTTLVLLGHAVHVDLTALTLTHFYDVSFGLRGAPLSSTVVQPLTLMPLAALGYRFNIGSGEVSNLGWNVTRSGAVTYDSTFDGYVTGRGTNTLVVKGYAVEVDARALGPGQFQLFSLLFIGPSDQETVQTFQLLPTPWYQLYTPVLASSPDTRFTFVLLDDGKLAYDPSLDACVRGRGTSTLTVGCDPANPPSAQDRLANLQQLVGSLSGSAFSNRNHQKALANKLDAVNRLVNDALAATDPTVRNAKLQQAIDKLQLDIRPKTDGCALSGAPDQNDWIVDCAVQSQVLAQVDFLIAALASSIV